MAKGKRKSKHKEKIRQPQKQLAPDSLAPDPYPRKLKLLLGAIIAVVAFALYANSLGHEFVLDDSNAITENHVVKQGIEGIPTLLTTSYRYGYWRAEGTLYRPLSLVMFAIEWELFPNNPFPGHLLNVLFYALTCFVLFLILARFLSAYNIIISFLITLLYTAHPIHTEVVANIKSMDEIMSFLLVLGALGFLIQYLKHNKVGFLAGAGVSYFLAFLSKESAITMIAVVPVMLYFFTKLPLNKILIATGVFALGAAAYLLLRMSILGDVSGVEDVLLIDNFLVGAKSNMEKMATATMLMGKYIRLLFFPHPLSIDYAYNQIPIVGWGNIKALISLAGYLGLIGVVIWRYKRKELWVFGIIFFLITMSLYTNIFITIGSAFGERFLYVPSLGFCISIVAGLAFLLKTDIFPERVPDSLSKVFKQSIPLTAVVVLAVLGYSFKTVTRSAQWSDHYTIYSSDVKHAPNSARLHYWYGNEIMKEDALKAKNPKEKVKHLDHSIEEYNRSLEIYPEYPDAYGMRGLAYYRKGQTLYKTPDNKYYEQAIKDYKKAISLSVGQAKVYNNLAVIYGEQGAYFNQQGNGSVARQKYEEALKTLKLSLKVEDRYPDAHKNIGSTYLVLGQFNEALKAYREALKYVPETSSKYRAEVYNYMAICYQNLGDQQNANKYRQMAIKLNPALKR